MALAGGIVSSLEVRADVVGSSKQVGQKQDEE